MADITPPEAAKYESHLERAKGPGSWVELSRAREYFAKANLQVCCQVPRCSSASTTLFCIGLVPRSSSLLGMAAQAADFIQGCHQSARHRSARRIAQAAAAAPACPAGCSSSA